MTLKGRKQNQIAKLKQHKFDTTDPLWKQVPKMGIEGLIATIEDKAELVQKLVKVSEYQKKMKRGIVDHES